MKRFVCRTSRKYDRSMYKVNIDKKNVLIVIPFKDAPHR